MIREIEIVSYENLNSLHIPMNRLNIFSGNNSNVEKIFNMVQQSMKISSVIESEITCNSLDISKRLKRSIANLFKYYNNLNMVVKYDGDFDIHIIKDSINNVLDISFSQEIDLNNYKLILKNMCVYEQNAQHMLESDHPYDGNDGMFKFFESKDVQNALSNRFLSVVDVPLTYLLGIDYDYLTKSQYHTGVILGALSIESKKPIALSMSHPEGGLALEKQINLFKYFTEFVNSGNNVLNILTDSHMGIFRMRTYEDAYNWVSMHFNMLKLDKYSKELSIFESYRDFRCKMETCSNREILKSINSEILEHVNRVLDSKLLLDGLKINTIYIRDNDAEKYSLKDFLQIIGGYTDNILIDEWQKIYDAYIDITLSVDDVEECICGSNCDGNCKCNHTHKH